MKRKTIAFALLGLLILLSVAGTLKYCHREKLPTKADKINQTNQILTDEKAEIDKRVENLDSAAVNDEYDRKRAENQ